MGGSRISGKGGGGGAATATKVFGGSRLKTLFGISKGGARPTRAPESASALPTCTPVCPPSEYYTHYSVCIGGPGIFPGDPPPPGILNLYFFKLSAFNRFIKICSYIS